MDDITAPAPVPGSRWDLSVPAAPQTSVVPDDFPHSHAYYLNLNGGEIVRRDPGTFPELMGATQMTWACWIKTAGSSGRLGGQSGESLHCVCAEGLFCNDYEFPGTGGTEVSGALSDNSDEEAPDCTNPDQLEEKARIWCIGMSADSVGAANLRAAADRIATRGDTCALFKPIIEGLLSAGMIRVFRASEST